MLKPKRLKKLKERLYLKGKIYRKVFIEDLPRYNSGEFIGCINWRSLHNTPVRFIYGDIQDTFIILYFDKQKDKMLVEYKDKQTWVHRSTLKRNQISRIVGAINSDFRYRIGDKYITNDSNFTIIDRRRNGKNKEYKFECNQCGFNANKPTFYKGENIDYWVSETNLKVGITCPCCGKKQTYVQTGINDIATTDKWMVDYFVDKEIAKKIMFGSEKRIEVICPICGNIKDKLISAYTLHTNKSINCPYCSDGKSYPEKFTMDLLRQLNIPFITEFSPKWANGKRYDFLLPDYDLIIEVDGGLGHGNKTYDNKTDYYGKAIDNYKDKIALDKNFVVLRVDAKKSKKEYLKTSFITSIGSIFDLSFVDWDSCERFALKSLIFDICNDYKNKISIGESANIHNISEKTVRRYIKRGKELKLID